MVTPTFSHVSTSVKTTQTSLAFCVLPETLAKAKDPSSPGADCTWTLKDGVREPYERALWPHTISTVALPPLIANAPPTVIPVAPATQPASSDLAAILQSTVIGMIYSNHTESCLLPQNIDVQVAFELTGETDAGGKLDFGVVNISDMQTWKRDFTNMIDVTFLLGKGSTATFEIK